MDTQSTTDGDALKAIEKTSEALLFTPRDGLSAALASDAVKADVWAYRTIQNHEVRRHAAVNMAEIADSQTHYKAALIKQAPDLFVDLEAAITENERRGAAKAIPGNSISQGLDLERIDDEVRRHTTPRPRITPDAVQTAEPANSTPPENDTEKAADVQHAFKSPVSLTRRFLHTNDQYYFREDTTVLAFEFAHDKIRSAHSDPDVARSMVELAEAKGWKTLVLKGTDGFRREAWLEASARGLTTQGYEPRDVDRAQLAEIRAQREKAHGNQRETRPAGMDDVGRDKSASVTHDAATGVERKNETPVIADEIPKLSPQQSTTIDALQGLLEERGDSPQQIAAVVADANKRFLQTRAFVGRLVEHGSASYHFDDKNSLSYYARLESKEGKQKVVWGIDLERAIKEGGVKPGDDIVVADQGRRPAVSVSVKDRDDRGQVIGQRAVMGQRVAWATQKIDELRDTARIAVERLADRTAKQPTVKVYDRQAPRPAIKPPVPSVMSPRNRDQMR